MKTIKIHLKIVAFLISSMILLQGCTIYKSTTVTLDEAYKAHTKTKVFTTDNETLKFKKNRNGLSEIAIFDALKACFGTKLTPKKALR